MAFVMALLDKFERVHKTGSGWMARCPCHEDSTASLHVSVRDDKILLKCHGCNASAEEIVRAVGCEMKDLFLSDNKKPAGKSKFEIVAIYSYNDRDGKLAYQNCRIRTDKENKTFRVRRPRKKNETGGGRDPKWFWGLERDVRRYPYFLADLMAAPKGATVWINNGEKSCERFKAQDLLTTCSVGGEGKWPAEEEFNEFFRGMRCVVLADNDPCSNELEPRRPAVLCGRRYTKKSDCKAKDGIHHYSTKGTCKNIIEPEVQSVLCGRLITDDPQKCLGRGGPNHIYKGLEHALDVREKVSPFAVDFRILTAAELSRIVPIPKKGDGWDFFEAGGTVKDLLSLAAGLPSLSSFPKGGTPPRYEPAPFSAAPLPGPGGMTHDLLRDWWIEQSRPTVFRSGMEKGGFFRYKDGLWKPLGKYIVRRELLRVIERLKNEKLKPQSSILNSVYELAAAGTAVPDEIFDADRDHLICKNGTLHIPTRELRPHNQELYATTGVDYDYDLKAKGPGWKRFIDRLKKQISPAVVSFLQEYAGLCVTTDTKYEVMLWLQGKRGSGKSTFITGLIAALGDRYGLLGLQDIDESRFMLSTLIGKTMAVSTEQPTKYGKGFSVVNAIVSGEEIQIDRKFRDPLVIKPYCKLVWAMNDFPVVRDPNSGLWRRLKIVKFPQIPELERDPDLKNQIETEGAAILNWCLEGEARLRARNRFDVPASVTLAVEQFEAESDIPAVFIRECCYSGEELKDLIRGKKLRDVGCPGSALYQAYRDWSDRTGHGALSSTRIADDWRRLGFEKYEVGGRSRWRGVALRPDAGIADGGLLDEGKPEKWEI